MLGGVVAGVAILAITPIFKTMLYRQPPMPIGKSDTIDTIRSRMRNWHSEFEENSRMLREAQAQAQDPDLQLKLAFQSASLADANATEPQSPEEATAQAGRYQHDLSRRQEDLRHQGVLLKREFDVANAD
jgi:hypothetical protein